MIEKLTSRETHLGRPLSLGALGEAGRALMGDFVLVDAVGRTRVSNNEKAADFVLVHESPVSKKRELRASKELSETDKQALALLVKGEADADEMGVAAAEMGVRENGEIDEVGATVMPSPDRRPSYKNGRRISDPDIQPAWRRVDTAGTPKAKGASAEPESPTAVVDSFFGQLLPQGSGQNLLGPVM